MRNILDTKMGLMYYDYLTSLIDVDDKNMLYETLLQHLYNVEFKWLEKIPLDRNRAVDGIDLRKNYINLFVSSSGNDVNLEVMEFENLMNDRPCSVLEMLVAFANRLTQIITLDISQYFWMFIDNLGLGWATEYDFDIDIVDRILYDFMFGTVNGLPPGKDVNLGKNPPVLFPCREVFMNLDKDLYMQANLYLKSYFL